MSVSLNVKWGKETFTISFDPTKGVSDLKSILQNKTNVPTERMKLMPKSKGLWKGILKDDFDLTSIDYTKVKPVPIQILLMGSAAKLTGPKVKTVFIEDLPEEEAAKVAPEPSGLVNLGNTCYLNSVVQCLRAIPELKAGLTYAANRPTSSSNDNASSSSSSFAASAAAGLGGVANGSGGGQSSKMLVSTLKDLYNNLERTTKPVQPTRFVMATKLAFPQFAQTGPNGAPMQQDAEEFYSGLLTNMAHETKGNDIIRAAGLIKDGDDEKNQSDNDNLVDVLFGIQMEETYTCDELDGGDAGGKEDGGDNTMEVDGVGSEAAVVRRDLHRKLVCNIQGGSDASSQTNVTHIMEGIELSLNGKVEKRSEVLGRDAIWTRKQRISKLPPILAVQFGRFFWKETPDSQDHAGVKCKVMKPVAFNGTLDLYDFCTEKVQKILKKSRDAALAEEEDRIAKKLKGETSETTATDVDAKEASKSEGGEGMDVDAEDEDLKAALAMSLQETNDTTNENENKESIDTFIGQGLPKDFQGKYELFAVVTHKGRDADGGHYMGWVKAESQQLEVGQSRKIADTDEDNDDWFVFDDDEVSPCDTESVLKLKGGGDWHMSYMNFYRAKK